MTDVTNEPISDLVNRIQFMEKKLAIFETKMDHLTAMLGRVVEKMDGHYVTKQEMELRVEILNRDIISAKNTASKTSADIEWVTRGVLGSIGGVIVLFILKVLPLTNGVIK